MLAHLDLPEEDIRLAARVRQRLEGKAKPPGSLGRLEELALRLAVRQATEAPVAAPAWLVIAAGDHGLHAEGVSPWPQSVTCGMVRMFLEGGAASSVLAGVVGAEVIVVDAGLATPIEDPKLRRAGIRRGTRNAAKENALTAGEVAAALAYGDRLAREADEAGVRVVALGEMGIGNTTAAALLAHLVTGLPVGDLVGPGAGLGPGGLGLKRRVVERAAARRPGPLRGAEALAVAGGLESAVLAGLAIGCAHRRIPVLVDGYIATAAVLAAVADRPELAGALIFAHRSGEPGHALMLRHLGAAPLLDLGLRLGEGTGALLALPLLRAACAILSDMASLEAAGVAAVAIP